VEWIDPIREAIRRDAIDAVAALGCITGCGVRPAPRLARLELATSSTNSPTTAYACSSLLATATSTTTSMSGYVATHRS
jgi:hypothetical protein